MAKYETNEKAEHREALGIQLQTMWTALSISDPARHPALRKRLDELLVGRTSDVGWTDLNEAQLLLLHFMPATTLKARLGRDAGQALRLGVITQKQHDEIEAFVADPKTPEDGLLDTYRALLEEMQRNFISVRFQREKRLAAGTTLLWTFAVILVVALLPLLALSVANSSTDASAWTKAYLFRDPFFGVYAAASFGVVGAFFSRLVPFQRRLDHLDYDQLLFSFSPRFIALRCAIGLLGALIFYLFMRSGLVQVDVFPRFEPTEGEAPAMPDLCKLLVWSFIAGWSERLVPDTLERTESKAEGKAEVHAP